MKMKYFQNTIAYLRRYCENCTIVGFAYIANKRLHFSERFFWLLCIIASTFGAYLLINQYRIDFESKAVSIVYDTLPLNSKIKFPTISVCNYFFKKTIPQGVEDYIRSVCTVDCSDDNYDYETEGQLLMFVYPHLYHVGSIRSKCDKLANCDTCNKCLPKEERFFIEDIAFNCTEMFVECSASGEIFDCCHYFRPLVTPLGKCYILNSLQNNEPASPHWFQKEVNAVGDSIEMQIVAQKPMHVSVLNPEDLPNLVMSGTSVLILRSGQSKQFSVFMEKTMNDPDVRDISPDYRKCRFTDEVLPTSIYKAHSFSACLTDCIRQHQLSLCNCTMQSMVPEADPRNPPCTLDGLYCLESYSMIRPDAKNLLPWANSNTTCECLPSCTENEISAVYESRSMMVRGNPNYTLTLAMPDMSTENYRRQALRTRLDIVVTIGGILGLFLGASIISFIELMYYVVLWLFSICAACYARREIDVTKSQKPRLENRK